MRVVVVCDHEPLPTDQGDRRLMRAGMLTAALANAGHEVTWYTSSFDHYRKRQREPVDTTQQVSERLTIRVLGAPGYPANISPRRVAHNARFAQALDRALRAEGRPDIVIAAIPATESASVAVRFAKARGIPAIVDVYDPWPDSFSAVMPAIILLLGAPVIRLLHRQAQFACGNAEALFAISQSYLAWGQKKGARKGIKNDRVFPLSYMPVPFEEAKRQAVLARLGIEPHHRVVSFVGTWGMTQDFGPVFAAADALTDDPRVRFVLAGDSSERADLRSAFERLPNVSLPGWLDATELAILLSATDVGLLPYRSDAPQTLPNKIFEYMAYGAFQLGTLHGEAEAIYARTAAGRAIAPTSEALIDALREYFAGPLSAQRERRVAAFRTSYAGTAVYGEMVAHVEAIAAGR